jgi:WD40 repeat protein
MKSHPYTVSFLISFCSAALVSAQVGHTSRIMDIAITPDGRTVVSGSADGTIKLWRFSDGVLLRTLRDSVTGNDSGVPLSLAITPESNAVVAGTRDGDINVWRISDGELLRTLVPPSGLNPDIPNDIYSVAVSPDGKKVVSGGRDYTVKVWNLSDGALLRTISGHTSWVNCVAISPDGSVIVSGSDDQSVRRWSLQYGASFGSLGDALDARNVAFTSDGKTIAIVGGMSDQRVRIRDFPNGSLLRMIPVLDIGSSGHTSRLTSVTITPDDSTVVSAGADGSMKVWGLHDGMLRRSIPVPWSEEAKNSVAIGSIAVDSTGTVIVSGNNDGVVAAWRLSDGALLWSSANSTVDVRNPAATPDPPAPILYQAHPNPFNPSTTIRFRLTDAGHVRLSVYTPTGQHVRTLLDGVSNSGQHEVVWDGRSDTGISVGSGVYVYELRTAAETVVRRMTLLR